MGADGIAPDTVHIDGCGRIAAHRDAEPDVRSPDIRHQTEDLGTVEILGFPRVRASRRLVFCHLISLRKPRSLRLAGQRCQPKSRAILSRIYLNMVRLLQQTCPIDTVV